MNARVWELSRVVELRTNWHIFRSRSTWQNQFQLKQWRARWRRPQQLAICHIYHRQIESLALALACNHLSKTHSNCCGFVLAALLLACCKSTSWNSNISTDTALSLSVKTFQQIVGKSAVTFQSVERSRNDFGGEFFSWEMGSFVLSLSSHRHSTPTYWSFSDFPWDELSLQKPFTTNKLLADDENEIKAEKGTHTADEREARLKLNKTHSNSTTFSRKKSLKTLAKIWNS